MTPIKKKKNMKKEEVGKGNHRNPEKYLDSSKTREKSLAYDRERTGLIEGKKFDEAATRKRKRDRAAQVRR